MSTSKLTDRQKTILLVALLATLGAVVAPNRRRLHCDGFGSS